ncbi:MAG: hypothetical protein AB7C91_06880 [Sphaerochaeta sp.]|jgi:hypothetical protein|uniref:hypothetical protein n=1 Tax=Sphaerochaeta sp. TaxID=1972642 RepID=UPI002FCC9963
MKKFRAIILMVVLATCLSSFVAAAGINDTVVLRLHAYVPEKTTFSAEEDGFSVVSNAYNFSYSVFEQGLNRTLYVVAN